jgi:hypothetical protein
MKTLNDSIYSHGTEYHRNKIVKFETKTYKICYQNRNGVTGVDVSIMDNNGVFIQVLSKYDINHVFKASYVSENHLKTSDSEVAIALAIKIINKVYFSEPEPNYLKPIDAIRKPKNKTKV